MAATAPIKSGPQLPMSLRFTTKPTLLQYVAGTVTYLLLATDVFRGGCGLRSLNMALVEPNVFHERGPVGYSVANHSANGQSQYGAIIPPTVAYTEHPTSLGLRSIVSHLKNVQWISADMNGLDVLNTFVSAVDAFGNSSLNNTVHVRLATRLVTDDFIDSKNPLAHIGLFLPKAQVSRTVWISRFQNWKIGSTLCSDLEDRPLLCEKPWAFIPSDASRGADTTPPPKDSVWESIERTTNAIVKSNTQNAVVDLTIVETESDPIMVAGSGILVARGVYDIVILSRVRPCGAMNCLPSTIYDHRFEGQLLYTDVQEWYWTLSVLRIFGQAYNLIRLMFLFLGCYATATGASFSERIQQSLQIFFLIPSQVVVYGSWIPLLCYGAAHLADVTNLYELAWPWFFQSSATFTTILQMLAVHMRIVWIIAFFWRIGVYFRSGSMLQAIQGYVGFKGHGFALLGALSMLLLCKDGVLLPATLLQSWLVEPSTSIAFVRSCTIVNWKHGSEGIYSEVFAIIFLVFVTSLFNYALWIFESFQSYRNGFLAEQAPKARNIFLCTTTNVPYAAGHLWDSTILCVGWDDDFFLSSKLMPENERFILMNITGLTDPLNMLLVWFEANKISLYQYEDKDGSFLHPLSPSNLKPIINCEPKQISNHLIMKLSWTQIVQCR